VVIRRGRRGRGESGRVQTQAEGRIDRWMARLTLFRAVRAVVAIAFLLALVGGTLERLVEPDTFTSLGLAYWFSAVTVTTVGYGDVVPHSDGGRVVAVGLMLVGIAFIPILSSVIVSVLVGKRTQSQSREHAEALERIEEQIAQIQAGLK